MEGSCNRENVVAVEGKFALKQLVANQLTFIVEKSLEANYQVSYRNLQSTFQLMMYNVVEQVMLDMLRIDIIRETFDARNVNCFGIDGAND